MNERTVELVRSTLEEFKDELGAAVEDVTEETVLFGSTSALDSMGLVTFLLEVEQRAEEQYGVPVRLMDDRAMSQNHSPFRSVRSLAEYISTLLAEERCDVGP